MKSKLIEYAKNNGFDLEISEKNCKSVDISTLNDKVKSFEVGDITGYIIKAIKDGKCLTITTENIENPAKIIANLETIFALQENKNQNRLCEGNLSNKLRVKEDLDYNKIKEEIIAFNKEVLSKYSLVTSIETMYSHYTNSYAINNEKSSLEDECYHNEYLASITVKDKEIARISYISYFSINYDFDKFKEKVFDGIDELLLKLDSDSVKTDKYNIILKNGAAANILNAFSLMFHSRGIDMKESVLTDKFNKKVFSDKITIAEDPNGENTIIKRAFDSEGVKTYYKELIKDGVFVKKINNLEYAIKNNEEPTGNAYGVNNLYIKPGTTSYNDLVKKLNNGIIIDEVIGLHAGIDQKNGNISLQASGFLVEDGKIVKGLNMIILSSNLFELFGNILEVGSDISTDSADVTSPSLLIKDITITGKK